MAECHNCGNDYDHSLEITLEGRTYHFDSFECAIHMLAPTCDVCGCKIMGHGVQADDRYFCGAHCARRVGVSGVRTHVEGPGGEPGRAT